MCTCIFGLHFKEKRIGALKLYLLWRLFYTWHLCFSDPLQIQGQRLSSALKPYPKSRCPFGKRYSLRSEFRHARFSWRLTLDYAISTRTLHTSFGRSVLRKCPSKVFASRNKNASFFFTIDSDRLIGPAYFVCCQPITARFEFSRHTTKVVTSGFTGSCPGYLMECKKVCLRKHFTKSQIQKMCPVCFSSTRWSTLLTFRFRSPSTQLPLPLHWASIFTTSTKALRRKPIWRVCFRRWSSSTGPAKLLTKKTRFRHWVTRQVRENFQNGLQCIVKVFHLRRFSWKIHRKIFLRETLPCALNRDLIFHKPSRR